jgi:hypothetical protein
VLGKEGTWNLVEKAIKMPKSIYKKQGDQRNNMFMDMYLLYTLPHPFSPTVPVQNFRCLVACGMNILQSYLEEYGYQVFSHM